MSMYTQMLDAAIGDLAPGDRRASEVSAVQVARRCRDEIAGEPAGADDDIVPMVLAREIGYDVALLQLARLLGIESDPSRFSQPRQEGAPRAGTPRPRRRPRGVRGHRAGGHRNLTGPQVPVASALAS